MTALFVAHGSPMIALEDDAYNRSLAELAAALPRPKAVLIASAHWEASQPVRVGSSTHLRTIHDFGGFSDELHRISYPAVGAPEVAARVVGLLERAGISAVVDAERGLDHGAWVVLRFMFPDASVPIVPISLPIPRTPKSLLQLGRTLGDLRRDSVVIVGSGGIVHNLRRVNLGNKYAPVDDWAREFDAWVAEKLAAFDLAALSEYRSHAPHATEAVPTPEHFDPLFVVLGAASADDERRTIFEGFHHGNLSMRSMAFIDRALSS